MRSENAIRIVFAVLLALTLYLMYRIFQPFLPAIAWAVVLVVAFRPLYLRAVRLLRGRETLAAVLVSLLLAAFIVVPTVVAAVKVAQGLTAAYGWLEARTQSGQPLVDLERLPWVSDAVTWIQERIDVAELDLQAITLSALKSLGGILAGPARNVAVNALQSVVSLVVVLFMTAILFRDGGRLLELVRKYLPLSETDRDQVIRDLGDTTRAVFFGVLFTALVQGTLGGIGFALMGVPQPVAFGAAMFLCALLPGGTAVVWAPVALWMLLSGHHLKGGFLLAWGVLVVSSVDNFLRPIFIGRGVKLPLALILFGTLGGMFAFGLIGLFIGPLVIVLFVFLLQVARRDFLRDAAQGPPV